MKTKSTQQHIGNKLKLDLHTHVWEATGFSEPTPQIVERVVRQVKGSGIDGIAITDHRNRGYGFAFKRLLDEHFPNEVIVIPGWEIEVKIGPGRNDEYQVAEMFLPNGGVFRSYCHPGYPTPRIVVNGVQAIEIDNLMHNWHIDKAKVEEVASQHDLLLVRVSDAHRLEELGGSYTEVTLEELCSRAQSSGSPLRGAPTKQGGRSGSL